MLYVVVPIIDFQLAAYLAGGELGKIALAVDVDAVPALRVFGIGIEAVKADLHPGVIDALVVNVEEEPALRNDEAYAAVMLTLRCGNSLVIANPGAAVFLVRPRSAACGRAGDFGCSSAFFFAVPAYPYGHCF